MPDKKGGPWLISTKCRASGTVKWIGICGGAAYLLEWLSRMFINISGGAP